MCMSARHHIKVQANVLGGMSLNLLCHIRANMSSNGFIPMDMHAQPACYCFKLCKVIPSIFGSNYTLLLRQWILNLGMTSPHHWYSGNPRLIDTTLLLHHLDSLPRTWAQHCCWTMHARWDLSHPAVTSTRITIYKKLCCHCHKVSTCKELSLS